MAEGGSPAVPDSLHSYTMLECRVCHDVFGLEGSRLPRLLACGHTVCHTCLVGLELQQAPTPHSHPARIFCPFDRQPTPLREDGGVFGLKKNFALIELLEKLHISVEQQTSNTTGSVTLPPTPDGVRLGDPYARERRLGVACDEQAAHIAVVYCVVCESHLCEVCSEETHRPKILGKHRRVPLSEKPPPKPKCPFHCAYGLEFVCQDPDCLVGEKLMCLLCRDYGRHSGHRHSLLESEAAQLRRDMTSSLDSFQEFTRELLDWATKVGRTLHELAGSSGTCDAARRQVRQHFMSLREQLLQQEQAALTVLEAHLRERTGVLAGQQEDLAAITSQVSAVCLQLDKALTLDNARMISQRNEMLSLIEAVQKQRIQFLELPKQLNLDSRVPLSFTKDNRVHMGPKVEMRMVALGLDGAGKTSILFKLKQNELLPGVSPTIGFNVETLDYKNLKLTLWDVGGLPKLRPLWKHYYLNTQALIFVVDSGDKERLAEVQSELVQLLSENELRDAALLVLANKQDVDGVLTAEEMAQTLTLSKLCYGRSWHIQPCSATTGEGLWEGMDWLARQLLSATLSPSPALST